MNSYKSYKWYTGFIMFFLYLPIAVLIFFSFNQSKSRNTFTGFTLDWYKQLFQNDEILSAVGVTLLVAVVASIVATVLGTAAAVGIRNMRRVPRTLVMNATYIPVINPEIVTGVSMMLLFVVIRNAVVSAGGSFELGVGTLILAHITFDVPYVILSVSPKLRQLDRSMYDAGLDLGCNPRQAFFKVVLPQIMPGIMTGFLMALTFSIDDFVISYFTAGKSQTLSMVIYAMTRRKISPEINALSTIMFMVIMSILLIMNARDLKSSRVKVKEKRL